MREEEEKKGGGDEQLAYGEEHNRRINFTDDSYWLTWERGDPRILAMKLQNNLLFVMSAQT